MGNLGFTRFSLPAAVLAGAGIIINQGMLAVLDGSFWICLWSFVQDTLVMGAACYGCSRWLRDTKSGSTRSVEPGEGEELEKLKMAGTLAAGIAHEIRNPLTSLKGFLQLSEQIEAPYKNIMLSEIDRINAIVKELLELASPNDSDRQPRAIQPLVQSVITLLQPQAILDNIQLMGRYGPETGMLVVHCSEGKLKQVLVNLIKNAMEAMPGGGNILISLNKEEDRVSIEIADDGPGIPPEQLERIGEPFFTTKEGGTGLGLMVSRQIIHEHHGTLSFRNSVKGGAVVTVELPIFYVNGGL
jgi:signal transduction histidine kinase